MSAKIAVVGSLNMDLVVYTSRHPRIGETILGDRFFANPGGKGANQAVAARRLGAPVMMIGKVGADQFGEQLLASLQANGVDTGGVQCDRDLPTGMALITIDAHGDNSIVVIPGSNMGLSPQDMEEASDRLAKAKLLLLQLEIPVATNLRAAQIAKAHGAKVILNPAPAQELPSDLLDLIDVLVLNESECAILSGLEVDGETNLMRAARSLKEEITGEVVLTMGAQGAVWVGESETLHLPAFAVEAIDTTAAGDAFIGGMAVAMLENRSMAEAVRLGNAAGALTVTQKGAQASLPDRQRCEELLSGA
jgi:ribokinase